MLPQKKKKETEWVEHTDDLEEFKQLWPYIQQMQTIADRYDIKDVLIDNGIKTLQTVLRLGLHILPGRTGNDAVRDNGKEIELKSVSTNLREITTCKDLNFETLERYRRTDWIISFYKNIELSSIWYVKAEELKELFDQWERYYNEHGKFQNNPKIPVKKYVFGHGEIIYQKETEFT
jgi:hypothetical protein